MPDSKLFADYLPRASDDPRRPPPAGLLVRPALPQDAAGLATLIAQREGRDYAQVYDRRVHELSAPPTSDKLLLVAVLDTQVLAFGRVKYVASVQFAPAEPSGPVPLGWYLDGLIVDPLWRRRGIAAHLTRHRLTWIAQRAPETFYFANSRNLPSIDLHRHLGFQQIQSDFHFPGAHFTGGTGLLFRAPTPLPPPP